MKEFVKLLGVRKLCVRLMFLAALVAAIVFGFTACRDPGSDPGGSGNQGLAPTKFTAALPDGTVGTAYNQTLTATGDTPITWSFVSGALPTGLGLAGTGVISGTPTTAGRFTFAVKATNAAGSGSKQFSLSIAGNGTPPPIGMVQIQGGTFTMGSPETEANRDTNETQHQVTLTGFYMGKYPVTQAQYEWIMGSNPSYFQPSTDPNYRGTENHPVEEVSWYDAIVFCNKLSTNKGLSLAYEMQTEADTAVWSSDPAAWGEVPRRPTGNDYKNDIDGYNAALAKFNAHAPRWNEVRMVTDSTGYRLPTEAQWEYACRAGTTAAYNTGDTISDNTGWYSSNSGDRTHSVGEKPANSWGLYDMHGNVHEWCWDWNGAYATEAQTDPTGAVSGSYRQIRGGAWVNLGWSLRSARRNNRDPNTWNDNHVGFRLTRPEE